MSKVAVSYTFGMWGLEASQQLVLKSLMRLLGERLQQSWRYVITEGDATAHSLSLLAVDVLFISSTFWQTLGRPSASAQAELVLVGSGEQPGLPAISFPFHAQELEQLLNQIKHRLKQMPEPPASESLVRFKSLVHYDTPAVAQTVATALPTAQTTTQMAMLPERCQFRLKRWPPAALVGMPSRAKLATLIASKEMNALELAQASGQSLQECEFLLRQLWTMNLLNAHESAPAYALQPQDANPKTGAGAGNSDSNSKRGLMAMIRARLGLR